MSKETAVIVLGVWIIILPFLGFPESWRVLFFVLSGGGLAVLGFFLRTEALERGGRSLRQTGSRPFTENLHRKNGEPDGHILGNEQEKEAAR